MIPGHWRQPKIIRLVAAAGLVALAGQAARADAQSPASCVPCLVIGMEGTSLEVTGELPPRSLEGLRVLVMAPSDSDPAREALRSLQAAGAFPGIALSSGSPIPDDILRVISFVIVEPAAGGTRRRSPDVLAQELSFEARTMITALRAARPGLDIVIDADAFAAAGASLETIAPYVDAVLGREGTWIRVPALTNPSADDLVAMSLTPGGERVLLPVDGVDWRVLQEFVARRATLVDVGGVRRLTVEEIVARYQAQQRRQDALVRTAIATGTTSLLFEVPGFVAPVTITAETTIFRGPDETDIEQRNIRVNGAAIAGGSAQSPPELPLIEPERIGTPPLVITLNEAYRYALDGEEAIDGARCYVVTFQPRTSGRGLAFGRAWINTADFTLRRLETGQGDLRGAIVSAEQVDEFGRVEVGADVVWLSTETRMFQTYEGAGFRTPIHRTITVARYDVNSAAFEERKQAALSSDNVMLRETPEGLRYLVRRGTNNSRAVESSAGHSVRSVIGGLLIDPNISAPLPFAGISYVNLNLFNKGAQLNVFFGGAYGQVSWSVPAIAGTRWQVHGDAVGIAFRYSDRVFRGGREQYSENLLQRPAKLSVGVLRPLTPRLRVTLDYELNITTLVRTNGTASVFRLPPTVVNHGVVVAIEAQRGAWGARGWWNPARRQQWGLWGLPGAFDAATRDYQRYGAKISRTLALRTAMSSRLELAWMAGHDLDRFSRYGVDSFDNPLHGYPTTSIRYDQAALLRSATAWSWRGWRIDAFGDIALARDPGWGPRPRGYPGVGAGLESAGPLRTLWSVEWGYGFQGRRPDGGRGTQTARITVYRGF
jgi:hypothetical protein